MPDPAAEARELIAAQEAEYGEYVAVEAISIDGVRAFNPGDPVPASHVKRKIVDSKQVAKTTTKAAEAVTKEG